MRQLSVNAGGKHILQSRLHNQARLFMRQKNYLRMATLKQVEAKELGDTDMQTLLPGVPITEYEDLGTKRLADVVDGQGRGIVFFTEKETPTAKVGHWLGIVRQGKTAEMFDPYGGKGDPWQKDHTWISARTAGKLHEDRPLLAQMLAQSGLQVVCNPHRLQAMRKGINTCGRHVVVRLWNHDKPIDAYAEWLTEQGNPDEVVAQLTYAKLRA
jgi:hypothetical protein